MMKSKAAGFFGFILLEALLLQGEEKEAQVEFNRDIRPVFQETCFQCHGVDAEKAKGELQLDTFEHATKPNSDGRRAIVPGHPEQSLAWELINSTDAEEVMPPVKSHKTLSAAQKELIRRWIKQGAVYQPHWAYLPPRAAPVPAVADPRWNGNFIDAFVAKRLEQAGLKPNDEAGRERLIRRLSLDLTGLLPEPTEIDAFVKNQDPKAYDKLVERLLASPRYGEHMARQWLDIARYADTHGIHFDNYRSIWPYRDWVIQAFNRNLPYDQFSIEQLAGDFLPKPTQDQLVATGYLRCNPSTSEGGAIAKEYLAIYAKDRVDAFSLAWLGLTTGCASCHDHKFDPIKQKEFYQLAAYFRNLDTPAMDGNQHDTPPSLAVFDADSLGKSEQLARDLESVKKDAAARILASQADFDAWVRDFRTQVPADTLLRLDPDADGAYVGQLAGKDLKLPSPAAKAGKDAKKRDPQQDPPRLGEVQCVIGDAAAFDGKDSFSYGCWIKAHGATGAILARMDTQDGHRGWDLWIEGGRIGAHLIDQWSNNAVKILSPAILDPKAWQHVFVTYDGRGGEGLSLYVNGLKVRDVEMPVNSFSGSLKTAVPLTLGRRSKGDGESAAAAQIRDLRIYARCLNPGEVALLSLDDKDLKWFAAAKDKRDAKVTARMQTLFAQVYDRGLLQLKQQISTLEGELAALQKGVVTLIARDKAGRASAHVLKRGMYDDEGEQVFPGVPAAIGVPLPAGAPENRLALARWLFHPDHPLTARVEANRLWQQFFGQGLVSTSHDLGSTGELPSHPELLDRLALQLRDSKWDLKAMIRFIVHSQAYRQDARATQEKLDKDPLNRLISRGPRHRLDAEVIRDSALQSSGLLVEKLGGPSVKPWQPAGLWEEVALPESNTRFYKPDQGEALRRRSLYTFIKRSAPPPDLEIFNATSRETPCARRDRTNTPLQALVTLNHPQFVAAARALAARALAGAEGDEARLSLAHFIVTGRRPDAARLAILTPALGRLRTYYRGHPEDAAALLGKDAPASAFPADEMAAWTLLASALLNLDEALNN